MTAAREPAGVGDPRGYGAAPGGMPAEGRHRIVIESVTPQVDGGRFPAKRVTGETVEVEADVFADGHEAIVAVLLWRHETESAWHESPMRPLGSDRWRAEFDVDRLGHYRFTVEAWVDRFVTWRHDLPKRIDSGQDIAVDLLIGAELVAGAVNRASGEDRRRLEGYARELGSGRVEEARRAALDESLEALMLAHPDRALAVRAERELPLWVDRERARCGAWYEFFPRSFGRDGRHGTFADCEKVLDYVAGMGFDVVYLPPIHPIGVSFRKGRNNSTEARPDDVGSPWAIGGAEGGHDAIHPALGTAADFERFLAAAASRGLEVALDLAFQCTPDHPWVKEHPQWFRARPDGTIQYAENPPKKYQDIYPIDFETDDWPALWDELKRVVMVWIGRGIRIFRVDNPHTKPFAFWEWLISSVRAQHPDVLFLSEAFTRPRVMYRLAKLGFTQSYTYFAWRNTRPEIEQYLTELTATRVSDFFHPNLWPNTPDILTEYLQFGGRPAFMIRLVLAATLGASYGIYGPAFELCDRTPRTPGSEEYLDSEKYQLRSWKLDDSWSLRDLISRVNRIRRENPALHGDRTLRFHPTDNPMLVCYSKTVPRGNNAVVVVVNLDPGHTQAGWITLDLAALGLDDGQPFQAHDELSDARYLWQGARNFVELNPHTMPAHVFRLRRRVRTERDFDYYL